MKDNAASLNGKQIEAIVFDMDGTLSDSIDVYFNIFNQSAATIGLKLDREEVMLCLANHIHIWKELLPDDLPMREQIVKKMNIATREIYNTTTPKVSLFANVEQIFKKLRDNDIKMGIVTGSLKTSLIPIYENKFEHYFEVMLSREDVILRKPDPAPIIACLKSMNVEPEKSVVVGDTPIDIIAGRKSGTFTVGVLNGVASRDMLEKEKPTAIIDWVGDMPTLLGI